MVTDLKILYNVNKEIICSNLNGDFFKSFARFSILRILCLGKIQNIFMQCNKYSVSKLEGKKTKKSLFL